MKLRRTAQGLLAACFLAGCTSLLAPRPETWKFFVLTPISSPVNEGTPVTAADHELQIGVGPITLPDYLDRRELVTRIGPNEMNISDTDRWAGSLDENFSHVLADNLSTVLGTWDVVMFPWHRPSSIDYQIRVKVERFDTGTDGSAHLIASWEIRNPSNDTILYTGGSDIDQAPRSGDSPAATLSYALATMSKQMADAIEHLRATHRAGTPLAQDSPDRIY